MLPGREECQDEVVVYTLGHSTRPLTKLLSILRKYSIKALVDVRRFPRSRRHPWFNKEVLERVVPERGIAYIWLGEELGGLGRSPYTDYMCSREYIKGIEMLENIVQEYRIVAIMCAEIDWRFCHRRYIAESMWRRGYKVIHIIDEGRCEEHPGLDEEIKCY